MIHTKLYFSRAVPVLKNPKIIFNCARRAGDVATANQTAEKQPINGRKTESELMKYLKRDVFYTKDEWKAIKSRAISNREATAVGFDGFCMGIFTGEKNFTAAKSLLNFLQSENVQPNAATLSRFMQLCSVCFDQAGEELILQTYEELKKLPNEFDLFTLKFIICGLSKTTKWRECLTLLSKMEELCTPPTTAYDSIASAAFRNKEPLVAFTVLEKMRSAKRIPSNDVFEEWFRLCKDSNEGQMQIYKLVFYCAHANLSLPLALVDSAKEIFETNSYRGSYGEILPDGYCKNCKMHLEKLEISAEDFRELRNTFMTRVIEGEDPYLKTNPAELGRFKEFVNSTLPYDVVLDGLNIGYFANNDRKNMAHRVLEVITQLKKMGKRKILVLGKMHMNGWPVKDMKQVKKTANIFLTENLSKDDPFLLHAALSSGPSTLVVSRDMMRDHKFNLGDDRLESLFRSWQLRHQMGFFTNAVTRRIELAPPITFNPIAQINDQSIHIPCCEDGVTDVQLIKSVPTKWLCITKR